MTSEGTPDSGIVPPTALVMIGSWPETEAELLVRDVALIRLESVDQLVALAADGQPRFAIVDVDASSRLDAALGLLEARRSDANLAKTRIAFVATEDTAMLSKVGHAFSRSLTALFVRPCAPSALFRKLELLGIPIPLAPAATLRPPDGPVSPRSRMSLPPLGIRERPSSIPVKSVTEPSPEPERIPPPPAAPRSVGTAARTALAAASGIPSMRGGLTAGLSPELRELLSDAEDRAEWYGEEFALPSPEEEVEAVLPKAVLEALEEPIDNFDDDELPPSLHGSPPSFEPNDGTTGVGHGDTDFGTRRDLRNRKNAREELSADDDPDEKTGSGATAERALTGTDRDVPTPRPPALTAPSRALLESDPPPTPPRSRPALRSPRPSPRPIRRPTPRPSPRPRIDTVAPVPSARPEAALGAPGDSLAALAAAASRGFDGILEFRAEEGVRVVRFLRGDVAFAASHVAGEGLADFLAVRGEMSKEKATRLARRMPAFGRFAAAALVASGVLAKDDMWTVLREHAAFVLDNIARLSEGTMTETDELGRLADEPPVFGALTGAEVVMDTIRRTVLEGDARARLGGLRGRLAFGPARALLAECGIEEPALRAIEHGEGQRLDSLASESQAEFATVVYGLSLLGVITVAGDLHDEHAEDAPTSLAEDSLDDEALRAAILARAALVDEGDYFALLGIHRGATHYEIRRAFLDLRRKFEPARALRPRTLDLKEDLRRILDVLDEAFEILGDTPRRERYLRALELPPV